MKRSTIFIIVTIGVLVILGLSIPGSYNKMVSLDEQVKSSWSQVENVYQRRLDLIPNLVNTVKGAANFEQETLTKVVEARAKATQVSIDPSKLTEENFKQFQAAQGELSSSLSRLLVTVEQYPQLTATQNFRDLQAQLEGTENRIATERRRFNETAQIYNAFIRKFPKNVYAGWFGFKAKPYFEAERAAASAPKVQF